MNKHFFWLITGILVLSLLPSFVFAQQSFSDDNNPSKYESHGLSSFDQMKERIASSLENNKQLLVERALLEKELAEINLSVRQRREEVGLLNSTARLPTIKKVNPKSFVESSQDALQQMQDELLIKQSHNTLLSGNIIDFEDKKHLYELQLSELKYQKRELNMELKLKESKAFEARQKIIEEMNALKNAIRNNLEKEKDLLHELASIEQNNVLTPDQIAQLKNDNAQLQKTIIDVQRQADFKNRERNLAKDKRLLAIRSTEHVQWAKQEQKADMSDAVNKLQLQYNNLEKRVEMGLAAKQRYEELIKTIIDVDRENEKLRNDISLLEEQLLAFDH